MAVKGYFKEAARGRRERKMVAGLEGHQKKESAGNKNPSSLTEIFLVCGSAGQREKERKKTSGRIQSG